MPTGTNIPQQDLGAAADYSKAPGLGSGQVGHKHPGTDLTSGTVPSARLGSGSASSTTFLRGDGTWAGVGGAGAAGAATQQTALTLTATLADTDLSFAAAANVAYAFVAYVRFTGVTNTESPVVLIAGPTGVAGEFWARSAQINTGTQTHHGLNDQSSTGITLTAAGAGGIVFAVIEGIFLNGSTAGNIRVQAKRGATAGVLAKGSSIFFSPASA